MRVVMWGTYDTGKPRTRILLKGLRANGVEVVECHADVWRGIEDKSQVAGFWHRASILLRWLFSYPVLVFRYLLLPPHDIVIVGYFGLIDVLVIWPFAKMRRVPIVWDVFIPVYNMVVEDRSLIGPRHILAQALFFVEWLAGRAADLVVLDTDAHRTYFAQSYGLPKKKTSSVLVGVEYDAFPRSEAANSWEDKTADLTVLFYGQFIPLHGVETIVEAARLTAHEEINWVIIGQGQEAPRIRDRLDQNPLPRLTWLPWVEYRDLVQWIERADICLGIFGATEKAARVIPNKVFQIIAAGAPLITRDSPAIQELLSESMPGVYLVPPNDSKELANTVRRFVTERHNLDGSNLHSEIRKIISPKVVVAPLLKAVRGYEAS